MTFSLPGLVLNIHYFTCSIISFKLQNDSLKVAMIIHHPHVELEGCKRKALDPSHTSEKSQSRN